MTNKTNICKPPCSRRLTKEDRSEAVTFGPVAALLGTGVVLIGLGLASPLPAWGRMWLLCIALFLMAKAAVLPAQDKAAFVFGWPGMDAGAFTRRATQPIYLIGRGSVNIVIGASLMGLVARQIADPLAATWVAMVGFIFFLHCGLFTLLAAYRRSRGRDVMPLMQAPLLTASVTEFWGKRWNHAFRDVAHAMLFKPVTRKYGALAGMWAVFLVSGLVHELVISVPAGAGYGGPTCYFALQAAVMSVERGCPVKQRWIWRLRALAVLLLPLPLLFHPPFVMNVCHPFFQTIGALP
ncbi:MAG: hypothetical protein JWO94_2936 [Verrucomicrobiaceae bacterium]|nr:hypothetical protein [Verrucomicrobiaceae bacterium]